MKFLYVRRIQISTSTFEVLNFVKPYEAQRLAIAKTIIAICKLKNLETSVPYQESFEFPSSQSFETICGKWTQQMIFFDDRSSIKCKSSEPAFHH